MSKEKNFLNEIAMKLGKVYTAKDNPPFRVDELDTSGGLHTMYGLDDEVSFDINQDDNLDGLEQGDFTDLGAIDTEDNETLTPKPSSVGLKLPASNDFVKRQKELDYLYGGGQYKRPEKTLQDRMWNQYVDKQMADPENKLFKSVSQQNLEDRLALTNKLSNVSNVPGQKTAGIPWLKIAAGGALALGAAKLYKKIRDRKRRQRQQDNYQPTGNRITEGVPNRSMELKKLLTNVEKTNKQYHAAMLDLYEWLRAMGLDKDADILLTAYKKNLITFKKVYLKILKKVEKMVKMRPPKNKYGKYA
tara:strand:- start:1767 stop:2675 length:909 start_codon:yes stop_codon:yes gene_type:complete